MKRIQFLVPDPRAREIDQLVERIGLSTRTDLFNYALTLFEWAVREREAGRIIGSLDEKQQRFKEIELPGFPAPGVARVPEEPRPCAGA